ncbi:MAG: tetratricopeptide repeat protein [Candidatus Rokubacteria bacterium]|nr:tetratricopeptide repeat protein [Candidatus Rokubacteria bacterium]
MGLGAVVLLGLLSAACATRGPVGSAAEERALQAEVEREERAFLKRVEVYGDRRLDEYLGGIVARLTDGDVREPRATVVVLLDPTLGAFAMPDGRIYVHTGLVSRLESEAQLAAVLAHELAHLREGHARAIGPAAPIPSADPREHPVLGRTARAIVGLELRVAAVAAIEGYGRRLERQADARALEGLARAGYDPSEAPSAFERLGADLEERGPMETLFFGSRQRLAERVASIRALLAERVPMVRATAASGGGFEDHVRALVRDNARADVATGRFALAQLQLERALASDPTDAIAHLDLGDLWRLLSQRAATPAEKAERLARARVSYERCLALDPSRPEPYRQLGFLAYEEKDVTGAIAWFRRYLAVSPQAPDARRIAEYLAALER